MEPKAKAVSALLEKINAKLYRGSTYADSGGIKSILDIVEGEENEVRSWLSISAPGIRIEEMDFNSGRTPPIPGFILEIQAILDKHKMVCFARIGRGGRPLISFIDSNGQNWRDYDRIFPDHVVKF